MTDMRTNQEQDPQPPSEPKTGQEQEQQNGQKESQRKSQKQEWGDAQMEEIMGNLLRAGVLLSAFVVLIGGVLYLMKYGNQHPDYRIFRGEPADLRGIVPILRFALAEHSRGLIQLGLLLLIATPIARVLFSIYAFLREHDWLYVCVAVIVLGVLIYSMVH